MLDPYVVARQLVKAFGRKRVLDEISLDVRAGDVIGVLGKNGAGKTTLLELMLGFTRPTSGNVRLFGQDSFLLPEAAKARVGFVPQQDELINEITGSDQLRVIGSFYRKWDGEMLRRLSATWELDLTERIKSMSVGQRQKLSILLALGHQPDLLVLDEPVASLDPLARRQFLEKIVEVSADARRSVIFSSHIVSDVERLANRIWILKEGRLDWSGDIDTLKDSVTRIHLRSSTPLAPDVLVPNALSIHREERYLTAVARDMTQAQREQLVLATGAQLEVQPLTLEEIFLELHQ